MRRGLRLGKALQQHLPGARQRRHARAARPGAGRARARPPARPGASAALGRQLQPRQPVRELEQVLQHHGRIGAGSVQRARAAPSAPAASPRISRFEQVEDAGCGRRGPACRAPAPRRPRRRHGRSPGRAATARRAPSRRRRARSAPAPRARSRRLSASAIAPRCATSIARLDAAQVEALAARQHRHRHLADLGGGEDELHMRRRLFQRLQQRVEGAASTACALRR